MFDGVRLVKNETGAAVFQADIVNTGATMVRPKVYLRVFDADLPGAWSPLVPFPERILEPDSTSGRLLAIQVPESALAGDYVLRLNARSPQDAELSSSFGRSRLSFLYRQAGAGFLGAIQNTETALTTRCSPRGNSQQTETCLPRRMEH